MNAIIERDIQSALMDACADAGVEYKHMPTDGRWHRTDVSGDRNGKGDASIMLFADGMGGIVCNWKGETKTFFVDDGRQLTDAERAERKQRANAAKKESDEKRARERNHAAAVSLDAVGKVRPAQNDNPYLLRKGLTAVDSLLEVEATELKSIVGYEPRARGESLTGRILIAPIYIGSLLVSLEFIDEAGRKSALKGGAKAGGHWAASAPTKTSRRILIAEGMADALTLHASTGDAAVAALSAANLAQVAEAMREAYPDAEIVIGGDLGNGAQEAIDAAAAVGGKVAFPDFGADRLANQKDFSDLYVAHGADAVKRCIDAPVAPSADTSESDSAGLLDDEPDAPIDDAPVSKGKRARSSDGCIPAGFTVTDRGVFYEEDDGTPHWICSELHVRALVRDRASENWGRLLEWNDADRHPHVWALPMEMLRSDGADMRGELARLGLDIAPGAKARNKLTEYVITSKPKARGRCVTRTGWYEGAFVFPDRTVGAARERVIFQAETVARAYSQAGTLSEWQQGVARYCPGNSRLLLAVSTAFASMLLQFSGQESGGLNFVGDSSTGKTTALRAACSVFGGKEYMQRWRATANGLEGLATLHNDTLLVLDELAQVDAREAGEIAYMLANGSGKARAGRSGAARARQTWQLLFLSAGEIGLSQHMQAVGKKTKAGQEVRLVEIPADAGAGFGLFESLHGMAGGAALSSAINEAAVRSYGTPAIAFLDALCAEIQEIEPWLKRETSAFLGRHLPANANGQAHRVCQRFALIGLAGEYATASGITGWEPQQALQAAADCFDVWMENRGGSGNQERASILSHVKAFFESHEESRFSDLADTSDRPTINRAGFRRCTETGIEYLVLPEVFKREICTGFDPKSVARNLIDAGWVRPSSDGKSQRSERLPGKGTTRVYVFTSALWEAQ
ncbi:putative DNA primase/helicase [Paraburkholderia atlantica]|uniref:TOPRIM and DUF927 domain-containing protein n=1 Tax=Paraburkholderia atlantica TaxID=2654982 RepID=UPI003D1919BC